MGSRSRSTLARAFKLPSVSIAPLQLTVTGGDTTFQPARFTIAPLRLVCSGGQVVAGPGTGSIALQPIVLRLDRMQRQVSYHDPRGLPTMQMQTLWQRHCEALEAFASRIGQQVADTQNLLAQVIAAQAKSDAALGTANTVQRVTSLAGSYPDPVNVLSADSAGNVLIAAHHRRYTDGASAAVNAGSLSGFAAGSWVTIYYVDAGREGGVVAYQGTTGAISQEGDTHIVGSVQIPQAGEPPASGTSPSAPGFTPPPDGTTYDPNYQEP